MIELIEKAFLTGLGVLSLSQKKLEEMLTELKEEYKMSEEEGRVLIEKMQTLAKEGKGRITEAAEIEVRKVLERIGLVPSADFEALKRRVEELEARLRETGSSS